MVKKPRLTETVLKGLDSLVGIGADTAFSYPESFDHWKKKDWQQARRACEWIRQMREYRHERKR